MSVWNVVEGEKRHLFLCGACAVSFYNAQRDARKAPQETEPNKGEKVRPCPEG